MGKQVCGTASFTSSSSLHILFTLSVRQTRLHNLPESDGYQTSPKEGGSRKERKELGCVAGLAVYCMSAVSTALPQATTHFFPSAPTLLLWVSLCPLTYSRMSPKKKYIQCVCVCLSSAQKSTEHHLVTKLLSYTWQGRN